MAKRLRISSMLTILFILSFACTGFSGFAYSYVIVPENCRGENLDRCLYSSHMDYIFISAEITPEEYNFFKKLDAEWDEIQPLPPIYVESIGGSSYSAEYVGRILRKRHATVYTGNPISRLDRAVCVSACVFIAAGAERRFLSGIGLHSGAYVEDLGRRGEIITEINDGSEREVLEYLRDMNIDDEVYNLIRATPNKNVHYIYYVPDFKLKSQLISKLGFRMEPTKAEREFLFERTSTVASADYYSHIVFAAVNGSVAAVRELIRRNESIAKGHTPNYDEAIHWSEYGVKLGDARIIHNYAVALGNGFYGAKDERRAVELYALGAEKGLPISQNNLGWHYYKGEGIEKNIPLAVYWITQAAMHEDYFAYGSLCEMHGAGDVFPHDDFEMFKWCELAVLNMQKGKARESSEIVMAQLMERMSDRQIDKASELLEHWTPIKKNDFQAKNVEDW